MGRNGAGRLWPLFGLFYIARRALIQPIRDGLFLRRHYTQAQVVSNVQGVRNGQITFDITIGRTQPKIVILSMFALEADVWYGHPGLDLFGMNISLPGLSPLHPQIHCTVSGDVCQLTVGEGEINAALSVLALTISPLFDLSATYWLVAGVAGINPEVASICSVTFARFAVQVSLQYEIDTRELPSNYTTGYIPYGVDSPSKYPQVIYGTEVFELNANLRDIAVSFARTAILNDSDSAKLYRAKYASEEAYKMGATPPGVYACDTTTSDVFYSGRLLGEAFGNFTKLMTNGHATYCSAGQEDNAILEALLRGALAGLVDFSRIMVMRAGSNFDRQHPGGEPAFNLFYSHQGGFVPASQNLYLAGIKVVEGILEGWEETFAEGIKASNYVGDIIGSLGGIPDFGPLNTNRNKKWT